MADQKKPAHMRKSETLQLRLVPAVKEALKYGTGSITSAVVTGETITEFMVQAALEKLKKERGIEVTFNEVRQHGKPVIRISEDQIEYLEPEEEI